MHTSLYPFKDIALMIRYNSNTNQRLISFTDAIASLTATLTEKLGHAPNYRAVFLPSVFQPYGYREIFQNIPGFTRRMPFVRRADTALCSCWGFFDGTSIPLHVGSEGPGEVNMVYVLEYEQGYLFAALDEACPEMPFFSEHEKLSRECGEQSRHVSNIDLHSEDRLAADELSQDVGEEAHHERLRQFVKDHLESFETQ
jgi:hypothetical protein